MSYHVATEPRCTGKEGAIELVIAPREKDLGEFSVRRVLPASERRMVGPFIFFDHMGPAEFAPGHGIQVRPHPHIGIATVTHLFEGEILHRDSLGVVQPIHPGAVNLMTAGRGIVHSERAGNTSLARRGCTASSLGWHCRTIGPRSIPRSNIILLRRCPRSAATERWFV